MKREQAASTMFSGAFMGAPFGVLPFSGGPRSYMHVKIDDAGYDVEANIDRVYRLWVDLNTENSW
jgi:hypothetical protein